MPLYEYACTLCHHKFDIRHGANEKPELSCPECQGAVKKVFHAAGIIFKGSGWYITDSAKKTTPDPSISTAQEKSEQTEKADADKAEKAGNSEKAEKTDSPVTTSAEACATPAAGKK